MMCEQLWVNQAFWRSCKRETTPALQMRGAFDRHFERVGTVRLETLTLRVLNPDAQRAFYCDVLGMSDLGANRIGYSEEEMALRFVEAQSPYAPQPSDLYWKIALSVPNIELAFTQLTQRGISCSEPTQFRDVGFLAKITDPEGFTIELIDHWFKGERPDAHHDPDKLGGGAHLSLLTLRACDIAAIESEVLGWGLTPLSVQPVVPYGFTLYFYAGNGETPPNPELTAIENRSWTYRRPYTVLEIQHVHALEHETRPSVGAAGYVGVSCRSSERLLRSDRLGFSRAK